MQRESLSRAVPRARSTTFASRLNRQSANELRLRLGVESLMKKFKDRAFAAGVDREEVTHAAEELGVDLREHVQFVIEAMREVAGELGLSGEAG